MVEEGTTGTEKEVMTKMEASIGSRLKHAWNAFLNRDPTNFYRDIGIGYSYRPDRPRLTRGNERSIVTSVYNRIALDAAAINVQHVRLDENNRFLSAIESGLNGCLTLEANVDQTGRAFLQDAVMSMLDEGSVAIVPVDTTFNPEVTNSYDINSMRTGKILDWHPNHVRIRVYNEKTGIKEDIELPKRMVAIVENPLYAVINEPNSTMQRLVRKLNLLDVVDEQSSSGKLDLIIQLPYVIKTEARRQQAENRRKDIENQLAGSKYGIAYTDGTERITQLNRSVENNLMKQIEYLTSMLYSQLGITQSILDGTADDKTMLNYYNRTIEPILSAIVDEMKRKFLTKTARSQLQSISFFRDPFKLVPVNEISEIADKFTRNEIMTSNEIRQIIGIKPSVDPKADELRNKNLNQSKNDQTDPPNNVAEEKIEKAIKK
ncbi:MAG: phage portal protein [Fermentimonas sp.]|nr:phage portal protein [Fermentimonas sp.]